MADLPALQLLQTALKELRKINSLEHVSDIDDYIKNSNQACIDAAETLKQVSWYAGQIQVQVKEVATEVKAATGAIRVKVEGLFESLEVTRVVRDEVNPNIKRLENALKLQKLAHDIADQRLEELVAETELALEKSKSTVAFTEEDISHLKGCLSAWKDAEDLKENDKQEQEKLKREREKKEKERDERRRKEEEERKCREKEEEERSRKKLEEEEKERQRLQQEEKERQAERKKKLEEEEKERQRLQLQQEEKERQAERKKKEEERRRQEEEERKRREEEEEERRRKKLEEEEKERQRLQLQQEEKERQAERKKKEEERRRKEEEERKRREKEEEERRRKKLEEEEKERQRLHREKMLAEKRRLDPDNWKQLEFTRPEVIDAVDNDTSYHKGICCIITAPEGSLKHDDVTCDASDEIDDVIEIIPPGEKVASSLTKIISTKGEIKTEVPLRVHVPHAPVSDPGEELVIMYSMNGCDHWATKYPTHTRKSPTSENIKTSCVELNGWSSVHLMAIARKKGETIEVDSTGKRHQLVQDKNMRLSIARDTFQEPTEIRVTVRPVSLKDPGNAWKQDSDVTKNILWAGPLTTLQCQRPPRKSLELDISRSQKGTTRKGKLYHVYRTRDGQWSLAPTELNGTLVTLSPGKTIYSHFELELPEHVSMEEVYKAAEAVFCMVTKTLVCVLVRQKSTDPTIGILQIVPTDALSQRLKELADKGYDFGDACSTEFALQDGDRMRASLAGNVKFPTESDGPIILTFLTLLDRARKQVKFAVKDTFLQRDFSKYMGRLVCEMLPRKNGGLTGDGLTVELPVYLRKVERPKSGISWIQVRFPHHLTALTTLLGVRLTSSADSDWFSVVKLLGQERKLAMLQRLAKKKCEDGDDAALCRMVLLDWMKEQPRHTDKVKPILEVLQQRQLYELHKEVKSFIEYFKVSLSDDVLRGVTAGLTGSPKDIGKALGFTSSEVEEITKPAMSRPSEQPFLLLAEWRETDRAVKYGLNAAQEMKSALAKFK